MKLLSILLALLLAAPTFAAPALAGEAFTFAAIGDLPYVRDKDRMLDPAARANAEFAALIGRINRAAPAFTLHVGDTKAGSTACTDAHLAFIAQLFARFEGPLVYTPGDNEWTDCHRRGADPLERLAAVRRLYFAEQHSLGARPLPLLRQPGFPENARWTRGGVVFATLHVVGSDNNRRLPEEWAARNAAGIAWMQAAFAEAKAEDAKAVVLAMQANPGWFCRLEDEFCRPTEGDGLAGTRALVEALAAEVAAFPRPVLMVHGDTHRFTVDMPLRRGKAVVTNFTRLEVFGEDDTHAVLVTVDPDDPAVFAFKPLL